MEGSLAHFSYLWRVFVWQVFTEHTFHSWDILRRTQFSNLPCWLLARSSPVLRWKLPPCFKTPCKRILNPLHARGLHFSIFKWVSPNNQKLSSPNCNWCHSHLKTQRQWNESPWQSAWGVHRCTNACVYMASNNYPFPRLNLAAPKEQLWSIMSLFKRSLSLYWYNIGFFNI